MPRVGKLIRGTGILAIAALALSACGSPGFNQAAATKVLQSVDVNLDRAGAITDVAGQVVYLDELSGSSDSSDASYDVAEVVNDLPVRVSTQYTTDDDTGSNLDDLEGHTGRVEIAVTVENLTLESEELTYDVAGESRETPALVGTPLSIAGSVELEGTGASNILVDPESETSTNGVVSQNTEGNAVIQWGTVLAPPQSEATTTFQVVADVEDFEAPGIDISVQPGFHTDMTFEGMLTSAFDTSPSSDYGMQQKAIELVAEVNDVLTRAGTTITEIRTNLDFTTETLGVEAAGNLRQSAEDVETEMRNLGAQLTALDAGVSSSLTGVSTAMDSQLSQMVSSLNGMLGDTSATPPSLLQGEGCSATLRDAESNGTLYSSIVLLGAQLDGYAEANAECRDQIIAELEHTLGPEVPTNEVCDEPSMTCALFAAEKSVLASMDQLVSDGQKIVDGLKPFPVADIREGNNEVGYRLDELDTELDAFDDRLERWDDMQGEALEETIDKLNAAHAALSTAHTGLDTLHGDIKTAYELREEAHQQRMALQKENLEADHDAVVAGLEAEHRAEVDALEDELADNQADIESYESRVKNLLQIGPDAEDANENFNSDIEVFLENQQKLADELCELRVEDPAPEPEPTEPTPTPTPTDGTTAPVDGEPTDDSTTEEVIPVDTSINKDIEKLRAKLVNTDCDDQSHKKFGKSLETQILELQERQDDAWADIMAIVDADAALITDNDSEEDAPVESDDESGESDTPEESRPEAEDIELTEIPLSDLKAQLDELEKDIRDLEKLVDLKDVTNVGSGGVKGHVKQVFETLTKIHDDATAHQSTLGAALDQFELDQQEHVETLGRDINTAFGEAADTTRKTFPALVDGQVRIVSQQLDNSRESIIESYNTTINGLLTTSDAMVTDTGAQIDEQRATMESEHKAASDALSGSTQDVIDMIHENTVTSTRDIEGAAALLSASLNNVILDLGDPNVQGSGILGSMTASSALSETADYQLALASQRASGYANVRSEDIGEIMLRQAQFSASMEAAANLPAFHLDVPSGATSHTMYAFHIGGDN